jgi:hypothetical protein
MSNEEFIDRLVATTRFNKATVIATFEALGRDQAKTERVIAQCNEQPGEPTHFMQSPAPISKSIAGFKIGAIEEESDHVAANTTCRNIEDTMVWVRAMLDSGRTKVVITQEDRSIRDTRRESGLDPNIEIHGPPGLRRPLNP